MSLVQVRAFLLRRKYGCGGRPIVTSMPSFAGQSVVVNVYGKWNQRNFRFAAPKAKSKTANFYLRTVVLSRIGNRHRRSVANAAPVHGANSTAVVLMARPRRESSLDDVEINHRDLRTEFIGSFALMEPTVRQIAS